MPLAMLVAVAALAPATAIAQSGATAQPRIVGGSTASISTYPWQVAVVFSPAQGSRGKTSSSGSSAVAR